MTMKKMTMILTGLMLSMIALAQPNFFISRHSEAEVYDNTVETYVREFIDKYDAKTYNNVISVIGKGTIINEMQILRDKGLNELADDVQGLRYIDSVKTCFVENGKFYVLTYKPVKNNNASNITKGIYLYRRDDDSMRIASDLICEDTRKDKKYQRETELNSDRDIYSTYTISDTALLKETPARVFVVQTKEWHPGDNYVYGNIVILLIPDGKLGYRSACFESDERFAVNQIESTSTNDGLTLKYQSGTIVFKSKKDNIGRDYISVAGTIKLTQN